MVVKAFGVIYGLPLPCYDVWGPDVSLVGNFPIGYPKKRSIRNTQKTMTSNSFPFRSLEFFLDLRTNRLGGGFFQTFLEFSPRKLGK